MSGPSLWHRLFGGAASGGKLERPDGQRWGRVCPHCGAPSKIRSSQQITPVYAEQLRWCENPLCGHTWIDSIEAIRTLSPPSEPNPEINIPLSRHIQRESIVALMNQAEQLDIFGGSNDGR